MFEDSGYRWALIVGMAIGSFFVRALFVFPGSRLRLPPTIEGVLRFAPAAALMAIVVPDLAMTGGRFAWSLANPRLIGGVAAFVVAFATRSIIFTILVGLVVMTLVRVLAG